jgi:transaldolase
MVTHAERVHQRFGQSLWYDNLERGLLRSGAFQALIDAGVRGCTSNPTIFEKAVRGSREYDSALEALVARGSDVEAIYYDLVVNDIQAAADLLRPVYDESEASDGYVSVEVQPRHCQDAEASVREARLLVERIWRDNLMIKVPGTEPGLAAVEALVAEGISVNVTLIFGVEQYRRVAGAYVAGLGRARQAGRDLSRVASVASFFVSRLDSAIDQQLQDRLASADGPLAERLRSLLGQAAIANCKRAYAAYREIFGAASFRELSGAQPQRVLWASTGTKNPAYPDTLYVDALIGPGTVNTLPPATRDAFLDHGSPERRVDRDLATAEAVLDDLGRLGIDVPETCNQLLEAGLSAFATSLDSLFEILTERRQALTRTQATGS